MTQQSGTEVGAVIASGSTPRLTLLFDGKCEFCRTCVRVFRLLDRARCVSCLDFNRHEAEGLLNSVPPKVRRCSIHLVGSDGSVQSGGPALRAALICALGYGPLASVLSAKPIASLIDSGYTLVSEHRGWFAGLGRFGRVCDIDDDP